MLHKLKFAASVRNFINILKCFSYQPRLKSNYSADLISVTTQKGVIMAEFSDVIYKSVDSIIEELKKPENIGLDSVRQLIATYERVKNEEIVKQTSEKKYPLVVLEGLDGCGKSTITKRLSNTLNAELLLTPPKCLLELRPLFDGDDFRKLRPLFYALGNYIAALQMKTILQHTPIVLDRFWHSTACYAIAQAVEDYPEKYTMPPEKHEIYSWPTDLLKPDKVFFLGVAEHIRLQRLSRRTEYTRQENLLKTSEVFRQNIVQCYKRMYEPDVVFINGNITKSKVEKEIMEHLQHISLFEDIAAAIL